MRGTSPKGSHHAASTNLRALFFSLLFIGCAAPRLAEAPASRASKGSKSVEEASPYEINGVEVDGEHFYRKLASMTEVPGTWYCEESEDGGAVGYDLKDEDGAIYSYIQGDTEILRRIED